MKSSYNYWARTALGLEELVVKELRLKLGISEFQSAHKSVFFTVDHAQSTESLLSIKTADDIFQYLGSCTGIDNKKSSSEKFIQHFKREVIPQLLKRGSANVRVTLSFLGQRNFNRYFIENLLGEVITSETDCRVFSNESADPWQEGEVRIRYHVEGEIAYCGIALSDKPLHRRPWRTAKYTAQLHPPVAAAMAGLIKAEDGDVIIDPFCGSGTLLIESALVNPDIRHAGFDTSLEAIKAAQENSRTAGVPVELTEREFISVYQNYSSYLIVSNPPWGERHEQEKLDSESNFLNRLAKIVSASKGAILLLPADCVSELENIGLTCVEVTQIRIKGKLASMVLWKADGT